MKTITEIKSQKTNKKRCNLFLDGEFFCGISLITVLKNRLKVGDKLKKTEIDRILIEDESEVCLEQALGYVARGQKTKMQVIKYLKNKNYLGIVIAKTVDKLLDYGYINDESYSLNYVSAKGLYSGKRAIAFELKMKGVDEKTIEKAIETAPSEEEGAYLLASKFFKNRTLEFENITKCYRKLVSKGFDYDVSKEVIERIKRENDYQED